MGTLLLMVMQDLKCGTIIPTAHVHHLVRGDHHAVDAAHGISPHDKKDLSYKDQGKNQAA